MSRTISKVLIANRGEIAVRVMRTLSALGIKSVAIYSEPDADAEHVRLADEAYCVGAAAPRESYLRTDTLLEVARLSGADAIHPGYGFLSENAAFAEAVEAAGLIWIGPPPAAISAMGSKIAARDAMIAAQVPVVPGLTLDLSKPESWLEATQAVGFPVLVKASAGGGGKGMRAVFEPADLVPAIEAASREAASAFGDATVYLERLLVKPRHVEIQIFGDKAGEVIALGERECSIQRRHQKVVEEAPSPALDEATRQAMCEAAINAGKAVNYCGAGTVEFMLDPQGHFYFLEMNTRLQVEHPVTECVTGLDLVRLQLEVAQGKTLADLVPAANRHLRGWSIEVRLYAEEPERDFLPATGTLLRYRLPNLPGVRLDTGFAEGDEVSVHYDPMLAKLIAWGETREHARLRLLAALREFEVHGVKTNLRFLTALLEHPAYAEGATHTGFIAEHWPEGFSLEAPSELVWLALAADEALPQGAHVESGSQGKAGPDLHAVWRQVGEGLGRAVGGAR